MYYQTSNACGRSANSWFCQWRRLTVENIAELSNVHEHSIFALSMDICTISLELSLRLEINIVQVSKGKLYQCHGVFSHLCSEFKSTNTTTTSWQLVSAVTSPVYKNRSYVSSYSVGWPWLASHGNHGFRHHWWCKNISRGCANICICQGKDI